MSYARDVKCKQYNCTETYTSDRWGTIRATREGWFIMRNGDSWCRLHIPGWVQEWRDRKKEKQMDLTSPEFMTSTVFIEKAKEIVYDYTRTRVESDKVPSTFGRDDVFVVWFCKTLQHWKAMVATSIPDGMYYEVTYNGDKKEVYLDSYMKTDNVVIHD